MPCFCGDSAAAGIFCIKKGVSSMSTADAGSAEIVWGARSIAQAIGRTEKATFAMLEQGKVAGAKKVAGRWAFSPKVFFKSFEDAAA
jgi:hypothetical protein